MPDTSAVPDQLLPDVPHIPGDDGPVAPGPCDGIPGGADCDDGNACTLNDTCVDGFCVGASELECGAPDGPCLDVTCDPMTGCIDTTSAESSPCEVSCFDSGVCIAGDCVPVSGTEVECPVPGDPCLAALGCDPSTGQCTVLIYALACPEGSLCVSDGALHCVATFQTTCMPCDSDVQCSDPAFPEQLALCVSSDASGAFCAEGCDSLTCPAGFECMAAEGTEASGNVCRPANGVECSCDPGWAGMGLTTECRHTNESGTCSGHRGCAPGGLTACDAAVPGDEVCDGIDNDCNGEVDEPFGACGETGACCVDEGCQLLYELSCKATGGLYQGADVSCGESACIPDAQGACCVSPLQCSPMDVLSCVANNGVYAGDAAQCADQDCSIPPELGPCCLASGSCSDLPSISCAIAGGVDQGPGKACIATPCPLLGACCFFGTTCAVTESTQCYSQGGGWSVNLNCEQVDCLLDTGAGACCFEGGGCAVLDQDQCGDLDGLFLKNEQCIGQCPTPANGACCSTAGECKAVLEEECNGTDTFEGVGSDCMDACKQPDGACCTSGGCFQFTKAQCGIVGGEYQGDEVDCEGACPDP